MDNREAKFILSAYRPGGQDANDRRFSEALNQARRDPILQRWFEESVAFDAAMTKKLGTIIPPDDLRESVLAGAKISRVSPWKNRFGRAIAAALIIAAGVGVAVWQKTRPVQAASWQTHALAVISSLVRNESSFDKESRNPGELIGWLRASHTPTAEKLPPKLEKLESLGCKTFSWNGTPVSVICFARPDGGLIHLVATNAMPASARRWTAKPAFVKQGEWTMMTWRERDNVYMLVVEGSAEPLRSYLPAS